MLLFRKPEGMFASECFLLYPLPKKKFKSRLVSLGSVLKASFSSTSL